MLAPAATVVGALSPDMPKPVPLTLACEIDSAAVPVFETVTVWLADVFTVWFPKLTAPGVTLIAGVDVATPVPVRPTVSGEGLALLVIVTLPAAAPVAAGWNVTVKLVLAPAATVTGAVSPAMLKPVPLSVACEIARSALPVFESFTVWVADVLTVRLPKLIAVGAAVMAGVDSVTPVPVRLTVTGAVVALLLIEMLAEAVPVVMG